MELKEELTDISGDLASIVGLENTSTDPAVLDAYSKDESFAPASKPRMVVKPGNTDEVQAIVRWANQTATPLVPVSSGPPHFRGDTVPGVPGAIIVDLSRMNRILMINRRNRMAVLEPGVTYNQLQAELAKEGLTLPAPLLPRASKSVIASLLEREPLVIPRHQWTMLEPLRCCEVIWGSGDRLWTGEAGDHPDSIPEQWQRLYYQVSPLGPHQLDYYRLVSGAQGSMGIVTCASVRLQILPRVHRLFFVPSEKLEKLIDFAYRVLRFRYGHELFILNGANLANILGQGAEQVNALKTETPSWVLILGIAGLERLPGERVEFQEKDTSDIAQQSGLRLLPAIEAASAGQLLKLLTAPSEGLPWKLRYKGGCQDLFFITTLDKTPEFVNAMKNLSASVEYPSSEMGVYIQPVNLGVACHCEFNLPYDPRDKKEMSKVQKLVTEGSQELTRQGAFFSRPYGGWAKMMYDVDQQETIVLKKVKDIFDPNHVMNPGKLCF